MIPRDASLKRTSQMTDLHAQRSIGRRFRFAVSITSSGTAAFGRRAT